MHGGLDKDSWTLLWKWAEAVAGQDGISRGGRKTAEQILHGWRVRLSVGLFKARVAHVSQGLRTVTNAGGATGYDISNGLRAPWRAGPAVCPDFGLNDFAPSVMESAFISIRGGAAGT